MIKVYIDVDKNNSILRFFSDAVEQPDQLKIDNKETILFNEGNGDNFIHAQNNLYPINLFNLQGQPLYYYKEGMSGLIRRSEEEINELYPIIITPTDLDKLDSRITYLEMITEPAVSVLTEDETIHSPMFDKLKYYYETKLWTAEMIQLAVTYKRITQAECDEILSLQTGGETV